MGAPFEILEGGNGRASPSRLRAVVAGKLGSVEGRFVPSPKELCAIFAEEDPDLEDLLHTTWVGPDGLISEFDQVDLMVRTIGKMV